MLRSLIFYSLFVPSTIIVTIFGSYYSCKNAEIGGMSKYFFICWLIAAIPVWTTVSIYTKNVVFDGLIFDMILLVGYFVCMTYFSGKYLQFSLSQYIFLLMMFFGCVGFKLSE